MQDKQRQTLAATGASLWEPLAGVHAVVIKGRLELSQRSERFLIASACLVQLVLATALARTNLPLCDEGFYGVPAHQLSVTGALRNPAMESAGFPKLRGIDRDVYLMAPLGMVLQAGAFKAFGFSLAAQRGLSVAAGLGAVLLYFVALRHLIPWPVAVLAALFFSVDFAFLGLASRGRADVLSLVFAMAAWAAYMHWRERSRTLALALAHAACAMSGMIHPNGGIGAVVSLIALMLYLDGWPDWRQAKVIAACYLVVALPWALYIAQAPDLFVAQFLGNGMNRLASHAGIALVIRSEVMRIVAAYGADDGSLVERARGLVPLSYLAAILFCAVSKPLRRQCGPLLPMLVAVWLSLAIFEGSKLNLYAVHLVPLFAAFLAVSVHRLWQSARMPLRILGVAQAAALLLGVASLVYSASGRHLQRLYQPAVAFLNAHTAPLDRVFAESEFYFGLQCRGCLRDDPNLGVVSGVSAKFIVLDSDYEGYLARLRVRDPVMSGRIDDDLKGNYREVFHNAAYRILGQAGDSPDVSQ